MPTRRKKPHKLFLHDLAVGTGATGFRTETDASGDVAVPADHYWGAQTQRSLTHFAIGDDRMPQELYRAYGYVKKAAALVNHAGGRLGTARKDAIVQAADEAILGRLDQEFPLFVWQADSGTTSNTNVNEVLANRASQLLGGQLGRKSPVHPDDHVDLGQSSNDTFPTAMHLATLLKIRGDTLRQIRALAEAIMVRAEEWVDVVKTGRTHLQDSTPLTVGQEWSGWAVQVHSAADRLEHALRAITELAVGGTAVGTGLNAPPGFRDAVIAELSQLTGEALRPAPSTFAAQGSLDAMVCVSAGLRGVAVALIKVANDMRWLASGPRAGLHELVLPADEAGPSAVPGEVNPTQQEAMVMVCLQVMGEDSVVAAAGSQGNFQLNAMRPLIIDNVLHSATILGNACDRIREFSVTGTRLDRARIDLFVGASPVLVTALSPVIGADEASAIARRAHDEGISLREAALDAGIRPEEFDRIVDPAALVGDPHRDLARARNITTAPRR